MAITFKPFTYAAAVALGAAVLAPLPASAVIIASTTTSFTGSVSRSWVCGPVLNGAATCNSDNNFGSIDVSTVGLMQFNPIQGILTGAAIKLRSTRTQTISGTLNNGVEGDTTTTGTGASDGKLTAPGVTATFGQITTSDSTTMGPGRITSFGPKVSNTATNTGVTAAGGALNAYLGAGTVTANLATASTFDVGSRFADGKPNLTSSSAQYQLGWSGDLTANYDYLLHAAPAFDSAGDRALTLDFGTVDQNATVGPLSFNLFNLLGPGISSTNQVGLDLDSVSGPAGGPLTTDLATFTNLGAGSFDPFQAFLDTSGLGDFSANYTLGLSDENIGVPASRNNYSLALNLKGNVVAPVGVPVPEPSGLSLLGAGLLGIGGVLRHRQRRKG